MHIYDLLNEMDELTDKLGAASAQLHDEDERHKIDGFRIKYHILFYQLRNLCDLIVMSLMQNSRFDDE